LYVGYWWESRKGTTGKTKSRWVDNIKMDHREIGLDGVDWIDTQDRDKWRALVNTLLNLGFHKMLGSS
jgi:hypothetical protein